MIFDKKISSLFLIGCLLTSLTSLAQPGSLDATLNTGTGPDHIIQEVQVQNDGKILVGGTFQNFDGSSAIGLLRLEADGSQDITFNSGGIGLSNGTIFSIQVQTDDKIIIGGTFSTYNGVQPNGVCYLTRLNADGTLDPSFQNGLTLGNGNVYRIVQQPDDQILIGGNFTNYGGSTMNRIARINPDGSLDTSFDPGTGLDGEVWAIAIQSDGKMVIGGNFTNCDGNPVGGIARLNANGSFDPSFNPGTGFNLLIEDVVIQPDGKILVGGSFTEYNGDAIQSIIRLNSDGSKDLTFDPGIGANGSVIDIELQSDGKILLGGRFSVPTSTSNITSKCIARLQANGNYDSTFYVATGVSGGGGTRRVAAITIQNDGLIIIGGYFSSYGGTNIASLARIHGECDGFFETSIDVVNACDNYTWIDGITYSTDNNTATFTLPSRFGCDSIVSLDLSLHSPTSSTDQITACGSYTWLDGNTYITDNSSATFITTNAYGCDSVISLQLTIEDLPDTSIVQSGLTLTAQEPGVTYQWLDCDNNYATITGANQQTFAPQMEGNYSVSVTKNNCTDTSSCYQVLSSDISGNLGPEVSIYPNPSNGEITLEITPELMGEEIHIFNSLGELISTDVITNSKMNLQINVKRGVYYLLIRTHRYSIVIM